MTKLIRWLPAVGWMVIIFILSNQQTPGITGSSSIHFVPVYWQRFFILKFFHLIEYGLLFLFLLFASRSTPKSFLIGYLYACTDEYHQSFTPGRTPRFRDTMIDLFGMFLGWLVINKIPLYFISRRHKS